MIHLGDLFDVLPTLDAESIDACVTDPPYGIGFMSKKWDTFKPVNVKQPERYTQPIESDNPNLKGRHRSPAISKSQIEYDRTVTGQRSFQAWTETWAREVLRVLKPGAYMLVCGAPRSFHRMTCGIEDAGFDVRDCLSWLYGQGFPKSLNIGGGRGTALKPGWEPIVLARKPMKLTVEKNVTLHGTGALNIDACRIDGGSRPWREPAVPRSGEGSEIYGAFEKEGSRVVADTDIGRWPANVCLDDAAAAMLDEQSGILTSGSNPTARGSDKLRGIYSEFKGQAACEAARGAEDGGASRFYYVAKPSREERDYGADALYHSGDSLPSRSGGEATARTDGSAGLNSPRAGAGRTGGARNFHPTVKPVELMRWLVRLVTPVDGVVLDPFTGSGTTGMAARYEQRRFIGIEREAEYVQIAERRIAAVAPLFGEASA